jgi:2-polyprenyl-6-methoxyphenol hydroxylase-like FAD-dependent oxidoreductase
MKILISGGGIGGLTVANFLYRQGHQPIIIDKAHAFSNAGFVISLKSFGVEIMNELGLEEKMRAIETHSNYLSFFKPSGELIREIDFRVINKNLSDSITAPRAALHNVLYEAVKNDVEIHFNTTINTVTQNGKEVAVQLSDNRLITADLLIIAEGIRSTTRSKVWSELEVEDFNIYYAAGRLTGKHSCQPGNYPTYRGVKKMLAVFPLNETELAIQCYIHTESIRNFKGFERGILSEAFKQFDKNGFEPLQRLETSGNIFSDRLGMVHASVLNKGRIVLLGDAGYCPTPLSGMGASLSIYGAKALAHFIKDAPGDLEKALANYNNIMQPIIRKFQSNARKNAKTFLPMSRIALALGNFIFKYIPLSRIAKKVGEELTLTSEQKNFTN